MLKSNGVGWPRVHALALGPIKKFSEISVGRNGEHFIFRQEMIIFNDEYAVVSMIKKE